MILSTAWKNMFRYKRRTIITAAAIAAGVMFSIMMEGLLFGTEKESERNLVWYETGAAQILPAEYFEEKETLPVSFFIPADQRKQLENFLTDENISYAPRFKTYCDIYFNEDFFETSGSLSGILTAVDISKDASVYKIHKDIVKGAWIGSENDTSIDNGISTGAVIGSWLAKDMKADTGYYITLQCKGKGGFIQTIDVPVVGILQSSNPVINASGVFMDLNYVDQMLELNGDVTEVSLSFGDISSTQRRYESFLKTFSSSSFASQGLELYSWRDIAADYLSLAKSKSGSSKIFLIFLFIVAAVGISNTMLMAVMERKHETGMLMTLGYSKAFIRILFMTEGICIGILGSIGGLITGFLVNFVLTEYGINFGSLLEGVDIGYRISNVMRSGWNFKAFFQIALGAVIVSGISALIPTRKMLRYEIAEIFREV